MTNKVPSTALQAGLLGLTMGIAILVWVCPKLSSGMYDQRLKQSGITNPFVFCWFRVIGTVQRIAFICGGALAVGVGLFGVALYFLGFFGLDPLHLAP